MFSRNCEHFQAPGALLAASSRTPTAVAAAVGAFPTPPPMFSFLVTSACPPCVILSFSDGIFGAVRLWIRRPFSGKCNVTHDGAPAYLRRHSRHRFPKEFAAAVELMGSPLKGS